jgi:hypothetical protein
LCCQRESADEQFLGLHVLEFDIGHASLLQTTSAADDDAFEDTMPAPVVAAQGACEERGFELSQD